MTAARRGPFAPSSTSTPTRPYVLLSLLPVWQKSLAFAYRIVLGTRQRPGLLLLDPRLVSGAPESPLRALAWTAMGPLLALGTSARRAIADPGERP
jgi:hypothetical protein